MAKYYQDFVGLNTFVYDSSSYEDSNALGWEGSLDLYQNADFLANFSTVPQNPDFFNALMSHRGNVYGYPIWRQIRASNNPLSRRLRKENIFNYTKEPNTVARLIEPVVIQNSPISLIGEVSIYNEDLGIFEKKPVEIKTALNNETSFFANDEANQHFNTILETDENYESIKEMYLDGGLGDEGSMLDAFALLTYTQTIWPKQQYAFLDQTRSRKFYVNTFWRNSRLDREEQDVDTGFEVSVPKQSMWPLDAASDFAIRTPQSAMVVTNSLGLNFLDLGHRVGAITASFGPRQNNAADGSGILMNSYSKFFNGLYRYAPGLFSDGDPSVGDGLGSTVASDLQLILSASCIYSRRHTIKSMQSNYNPSFPSTASSGNPFKSPEGVDHSLLTLDGSASMMLTSSLFEGMAAWDVASQAGKSPFYDSYEDYAEDLRVSGKGYSTVPEFRISSHVEHYETRGVSSALENIFESSGALSQNTTTENSDQFYQVLSNSDFLKHFDLIKKDHEGFTKESIITLKCKALKKFLPYEGFYPAQRTVDLAKQFASSHNDFVKSYYSEDATNPTTKISSSVGLIPIMEPLFSPGILFNTIKSGVAVDFPIMTRESNPNIISSSNNNYTSRWTDSDNDYSTEGPKQNYYLGGATRDEDVDILFSAFSQRIPFEALVNPKEYIANLEMIIQEPHPFGLSFTGSQGLNIYGSWSGHGDNLYSKMANNLLAEVTDFFMQGSNMKTISSLEEGDPNFGNAVSGTYYTMRLKMKRSKTESNRGLASFKGVVVDPPQDLITYQDRGGVTLATEPANNIRDRNRFGVRETLTMYSRPSAFGPPTYGGNGVGDYRGIEFRECGSFWGTNYPYTPPYYHGEAWCDLIFYANETKKYTLEEIMSSSAEYPYYTRFWWNGTLDNIRDLTGYSGSDYSGPYSNYDTSPWKQLLDLNGVEVAPYTPAVSSNYATWGRNIDSMVSSVEVNYLRRPTSAASLDPDKDHHPQHPFWLNYNAMQLDSSVNIFGKGTVRKVLDESRDTVSEVASADTIRGKTRWIIQPKFETPILNFKKYENLTENGGTMPLYASESVPRGMWHQYGEIPESPEVGVFLQADDIPGSWLKGAFCVSDINSQRSVASLADLVGFSKEPVRLGEVASQKEISECVVAVPFIEQDATRKFFSIPRADIDSCINASKREIDGNFPAGGPAKTGDTVYQMVKKMQKYVFPPSMDFVKYEEIEPFAMYVFEFKHTLSKQDLADIWQNLPPTIGTQMEEVESSISHELLAAELLGGGAVVKNNVLDENAEGKGMPSNIQWMIFKVKKRAKTNYFDKVVAKKGTTDETSGVQLVGITNAVTGKKDKEITYNWPYDFFSLVELVKIDAEVSFANIENDDKGQRSIKKVESEKTRDPSMINKARGKGRIE